MDQESLPVSSISSRPKRSNAGSLMSSLIQQQLESGILKIGTEDTDQTTKSHDIDFQILKDENDIIDSDFISTDEENEQETHDHKLSSSFIQNDSEIKKKSIRIIPKISKWEERGEVVEQSNLKKSRNRMKLKKGVLIGSRESKRSMTVANKLQLQEKMLAHSFKKAKLPRRIHSKKDQPPSQKELLDRAFELEPINLASIRKYDELEELRKKKVVRKVKVLSGPVLRYRSVQEQVINDDNEFEKKCRNSLEFVHFENDPFGEWKVEPIISNVLCPITGKRATYLDPKTKLPYCGINAYKTIQSVYHQEYIWSPLYGAYVHSHHDKVEGAPEGWMETTRGFVDSDIAVWEEKYLKQRQEDLILREARKEAQLQQQLLKHEQEQAALQLQQSIQPIQPIRPFQIGHHEQQTIPFQLGPIQETETIQTIKEN